MKTFARFSIAWLIAVFVFSVMVPFFIFMDWLTRDDFENTRSLIESWAGWAFPPVTVPK